MNAKLYYVLAAFYVACGVVNVMLNGLSEFKITAGLLITAAAMFFGARYIKKTKSEKHAPTSSGNLDRLS